MEKLELICGDCNMMFHSSRLLEKHKALLCIGSEVEHLRVQRESSKPLTRNKAGGVEPQRTRSPDPVQLRAQRRNGGRWRNVEPKAPRAEDEPAIRQRDGAALQKLTDEFHKLRMSIEENLPKWSERRPDAEASVHQLGHGERLKEMREMATLHERRLSLIHAHDQQLEQQRHELAHQVTTLTEQRNTAHVESLLMELREQEERNEETLQQLAEHLQALRVLEASLPADRPDPHKTEKTHHDNYELSSSADGSLSTQIKALRQAYMQSGGSDPAIVAQMTDLQAEAQSLEKNQPAAAAEARKKKVKPPQRGLSSELLVLEQENQRLEEEILRMQLAREKHGDYEAVKTELELIQTENLHRTARVRAEMEKRKAASSPRRQPPPPNPLLLQLHPKTHVHAPLSLLRTGSPSSPLGGYVLDPLGPAPYDPAAGFVVFYDLVLGVDVSQRALRLVSALYSNGEEVGPPVQCLPGVSLPYLHSPTPGNNVLISVKQPVPRMQPSPSLSLVVEVQAAGDLDVYNHVVFKLVSCGWTRLELFDQHNQLHSGHWRAPVRTLPIRPSLNAAQLNSIPQVGNMELCVRLVNGRDGDVQTLAKPDGSSTSRYRYPAVASSLSATVHGDAAPPVSAPQPTGLDELSSPLPFTGRRDPSPADRGSRSWDGTGQASQRLHF